MVVYTAHFPDDCAAPELPSGDNEDVLNTIALVSPKVLKQHGVRVSDYAFFNYNRMVCNYRAGCSAAIQTPTDEQEEC